MNFIIGVNNSMQIYKFIKTTIKKYFFVRHAPVFDWSYGFTLVELLVGMSVFITAMTIGTGVFIQGLKTQKLLMREMAVNNNMNLVLEQMARDIRTGFDFPEKGVYSELSFVGRDGKSIEFDFDGTAIYRTVGGRRLRMTSLDVDVASAKFNVQSKGTCDPWRVTILMMVAPIETASDVSRKLSKIQTTVSSRVLPRDIGEEKYQLCRL